MNAVIYWLHLIGLVFWVGGVFVNVLVLSPSLQVLNPPDRGKLMGAYLKRFMPLSWGAIALVGVTGLLMTNRILGFSALVSFGSSYANILLVKIILVGVMILNGVYMSAVLAPKMTSFAPPPGAPEPDSSGVAEPPPGPPPELVRLQSRMAISGWVQMGLAAVVLFLMGL